MDWRVGDDRTQQASAPPEPPLRRRLLRPKIVLAAMVMFYTIIVLLFGGLSVWRDRAVTLADADMNTTNYALLVEEHAKRTLEASDLILQRLLDRVRDRGVMALAASASDWAVMATAAKASPHTGALYLFDRDGGLVFTSRRLPADHPFNVADRDYFRALAGGGPQPFVGRSFFDPDTGRAAFPIARRIETADGAFAGVAVVTINIDYFQGFYRHLGFSEHAAFGVYKHDGSILVRLPMADADVGRTIPADAPMLVAMKSKAVDTFHAVSTYDWFPRVVSYRKIDDPAFVVWVATTPEDALAEWQARQARNGGLGLASLLVMGGLSWLVLRGIRREEAINVQLKRSNADLEQFAYIASHDLKEPLRMVASYVQLLQRRYQGRLDEEADEFIGFAVEGTRRMHKMIEDILSYARIGTESPGQQHTGAGEAAAAAVELLRAAIAEAGAVVDIGPLPTVPAVPSTLVSLFQNLIGNALKYRRAEVPCRIEVRAEETAGEWLFSVTDNGIGIESQYFDQLFRLFKRLHSRDQYAGNGIGLAVCKRIVEGNGGRIWLDSKLGEGTTFYFTMPKR